MTKKENCFAANGLGVICAEKEKYEAARQIFTAVRSFCVDYGRVSWCVWLCIVGGGSVYCYAGGAQSVVCGCHG